MRKLILAALLFSGGMMQAQQVTTYAGSYYVGLNGYSGATSGIPLLTDSFSRPYSMAVDSNGRFWAFEQHNAFVFDGNTSRVRGGFTGKPDNQDAAGYTDATGTVARFNNPHGSAVLLKTNDVYFTDYDNSTIRKGSKFVNASNPSIFSTLAGKPDFFGGYVDGTVCVDPKNDDWGTARFAGPEDIAIASDGTMYICEQYNHTIRKISGGQVTTVAGLGENSGDVNGVGTAARFYAPSGLFLVDDNTLLVADRNNGKIKSIDLSSKTVTTVVTGLNMPTDIVKVNGIIYIADSDCIRAWNGTTLSVFTGKYQTPGYVNSTDPTLVRFNEITLLCYDSKTQSIYAADLGNNVFRKITVSAPPVADFSANKTAVSVNEVVTITSSSTNATTLAWNISPSSYTLVNGSTLTDQKIYVTFQSVGSYTVELTATNATGNNKKTKTNYINVSLIGTNKPTVDFIADMTSATTSDVVSFIDQSSDNPQSWTWEFTPNTVSYQNGTTSTDRFPKVKFNAAGKYSVKLTCGNTNGSNSKNRADYITVAVASTPALTQPELSVYPNPTSSNLFIGNDATQAMVVTPQGRLIGTEINEGSIDVSELSAGIYTVRVLNTKGQTLTAVFVKE
jgi:PKD repeat protein